MVSTVTLRGISFEVHDCITCGIPYVVPLNVVEQQRENGGYHFCPNGHQQGWDKSRSRRVKEEQEREAIRQERDRLKQNAAYLEEQVRLERSARQTVERREAKLKKRTIINGVCPCCTRSFENLQRHMKTKHPDFTSEVVKFEAKAG